MNENQLITVYVQSTEGDRYECQIPADTRLDTLAADFFEERGWPVRDAQDRGQRAVVELVDPENPDRTKRLRGDQTVDDAGLWNGAILRVFPESIAGHVDERARLRALIADQRAMTELVKWNRRVSFTARPSEAPFVYTITMTYDSFLGLQEDGHTPRVGDHHQVEIRLGALYPRQAPTARWLTPIFHPNIDSGTGAVCLGVLMERYLPGLGLARIVTMLTEMVQWRNYDLEGVLNKEARRWAADPQNWEHIRRIGGAPFQALNPIAEVMKELGSQQRPKISFTRLS